MKKTLVAVSILLSALSVEAQTKYTPVHKREIIVDTAAFSRMVPGPGMVMTGSGSTQVLMRSDYTENVYTSEFIKLYEKYIRKNPEGTPTTFIAYLKTIKPKIK